MAGDRPDTKGQPGIATAALFGLCPKCSAKTLFANERWGTIQFAPRCRACGLDFGQFNVGDGPAAFITLIVGAVLVAFAIALEVAFTPPLWVHVVLWVPLTIGAVILALRAGKAALLAAEFQKNAGEGRLKE